MDFNDYQKKSKKTAIYPKGIDEWAYLALALCGEVGEAANKFKKIYRDDNGKVTKEKKEQILDELGDMLWYIAQIATHMRTPLEDVATRNIDKLYSRLKRGTIHGSGDNR